MAASRFPSWLLPIFLLQGEFLVSSWESQLIDFNDWQLSCKKRSKSIRRVLRNNWHRPFWTPTLLVLGSECGSKLVSSCFFVRAWGVQIGKKGFVSSHVSEQIPQIQELQSSLKKEPFFEASYFLGFCLYVFTDCKIFFALIAACVCGVVRSVEDTMLRDRYNQPSLDIFWNSGILTFTFCWPSLFITHLFHPNHAQNSLIPALDRVKKQPTKKGREGQVNQTHTWSFASEFLRTQNQIFVSLSSYWPQSMFLLRGFPAHRCQSLLVLLGPQTWVGLSMYGWAFSDCSLQWGFQEKGKHFGQICQRLGKLCMGGCGNLRESPSPCGFPLPSLLIFCCWTNFLHVQTANHKLHKIVLRRNCRCAFHRVDSLWNCFWRTNAQFCWAFELVFWERTE